MVKTIIPFNVLNISFWISFTHPKSSLKHFLSIHIYVIPARNVTYDNTNMMITFLGLLLILKYCWLSLCVTCIWCTEIFIAETNILYNQIKLTTLILYHTLLKPDRIKSQIFRRNIRTRNIGYSTNFIFWYYNFCSDYILWMPCDSKQFVTDINIIRGKDYTASILCLHR